MALYTDFLLSPSRMTGVPAAPKPESGNLSSQWAGRALARRQTLWAATGSGTCSLPWYLLDLALGTVPGGGLVVLLLLPQLHCIYPLASGPVPFNRWLWLLTGHFTLLSSSLDALLSFQDTADAGCSG